MADTEPVLASAQISSLSPEAKAHWKMTGEINPDASATTDTSDARPHSSTEADSSPAEPAAQVASTEVRPQPASEPGTRKPKSNAETRIKELLAENERLRALSARPAPSEPASSPRTPDAPVTSSTTTEKPSLAQFVEQPDLSKPRIDEVEFFSQFPDARLADYQDYRESYRDGLTKIRTASESRTTAISSQFQERLKPAVDADPQLWDGIPGALKTAQPTGITLAPNAPRTAWNDIARELVTSEHAGDLLAHFKAHPDDLTQIANLPDDLSVTRAMARVEARLTAASVPPRSVVRPRTTTAAPDPGTTLGRRTADVVDDAAAAVKGGDMARYKAIMNAREMTSR